jgi:glycosyltransferase involved in cell wall biosynthesis
MRWKRCYWQLRSLPGDIPGLLSDAAMQLKILGIFQACRVRSRLRSFKAGRRGQPAADTGGIGGDRLLVISYYSAPYRSTYGTQRTDKFIKYLVRMGWKVSLLTTQPHDAREEDPAEEPIPPAVTVIRLPPSWPRAVGGRHFLVPDDFIGWVLPAVEEVRQEVARRRPTALYATAPPYSNLLVGAIASVLCGLPLVSDFRDPWSRIDTLWVIDCPVLRWINQALEKQVLRMSHRVIMADELRYAREYFAEQPAQGRLVSITNGFDEEDFLGVSRPPASPVRRRFVVSYVGGFYDRETCESIARGFQAWYDGFPRDFDEVVFEYAGNSSSMFDRCEFRPAYLRDHGYVSHREAIDIRARSDLQLFAQPSHFKAHVMSGKIYEMVRIGAPILALTNPGGAVAQLIQRAAIGWVVDPRDAGQVATTMKEIYDRWRRAELKLDVRQDVVSSLSREHLTTRLAEVLADVKRG